MAITSVGYSTAGLHRQSARPGFIRRAFAAIISARQLKADREVAEILARHGTSSKVAGLARQGATARHG